MRNALWPTLLLLPLLAAAQGVTGNPAPATERTMVLQPTQTARYEGDLLQLRERLVITDAQQPAWARFAGSVEAYTKLVFAERPQSAYPQDTAPRQLERMNGRLHDRMLALQKVESQAGNLYTALSPQQRTSADQYLMASIPSFGLQPPTR